NRAPSSRAPAMICRIRLAPRESRSRPTITRAISGAARRSPTPAAARMIMGSSIAMSSVPLRLEEIAAEVVRPGRGKRFEIHQIYRSARPRLHLLLARGGIHVDPSTTGPLTLGNGNAENPVFEVGAYGVRIDVSRENE